MPDTHASHRRLDIQGLRAVGALLVAIYHIWVGRVSGGVDVFLFVSGYLLIGSLARQLESTGRVNLFRFLVRLANRLLPASLFVLFVLVLTCWLWLPTMQWWDTARQIAASTLYLQNWYLALNSVDYLARDQVASPVQHYWAMSVQVQALVIIALILGAFGVLSAILRRAISRRGILTVLGAISLCSLAYSVFITSQNQPFAYFDTFARVWQFTAGGIVAIGLAGIQLPAIYRLALGWLGLIAIVSCGIILDVSTVFPGYAALWPVAAAALVLVAGEGITSRYSANRLLSTPPLVWCGNISYSLYLWHWPVLILYLTLTYRTEATLAGGLAVLFVSILLAYATTELVDGRLRARIDRFHPVQTILVAVAAVCVMGIGVYTWNDHKNALIAKELAVEIEPERYPGSRALSAEGYDTGEQSFSPGPLTATRDRGIAYKDDCIQGWDRKALKTCSFGPASATRSMAVVGGSHSAHWMPALVRAMKAFPEWRLDAYLKSACPFSTETLDTEPRYQESCKVWNRSLQDRLQTDKPDVVFTLVTRTTYPDASSPEHVPDGYRGQWLPLLDEGITVIGMRDTPRPGFDVPYCVELNGRTADACTVSRSDLLESTNPALLLPEADELALIDMTDRFCTDAVCPPVIGNVLVYPDRGHVTASYMKTVSAILREELRPILTD